MEPSTQSKGIKMFSLLTKKDVILAAVTGAIGMGAQLYAQHSARKHALDDFEIIPLTEEQKERIDEENETEEPEIIDHEDES